jgi:hypothetical protein
MKSKEEILKRNVEAIANCNVKYNVIHQGIMNAMQEYANQCQEDMVNEIQSLIDGYKSYVLRLEEKFKDTCSALTLEKIVTLESVVENLESKFNKKD